MCASANRGLRLETTVRTFREDEVVRAGESTGFGGLNQHGEAANERHE